MRPLMKQMATLMGKSLREALTPLRAKQSELEARIKTLEAATGIEHKAGEEFRVVKSMNEAHTEPHNIGDVVRVDDGSGDWECVGPNRWRLRA